jgi:hypothetical protein
LYSVISQIFVPQEFSSVIETLDRGEMIHAKNFNLFDSMSALELMDRKMDSGMHIDDMAFLPPVDRMCQCESTFFFF